MKRRKQRVHRLQTKLGARASPCLPSAVLCISLSRHPRARLAPPGRGWHHLLHGPITHCPGTWEGEKPSSPTNPLKRLSLACSGHMLTPGPITGSRNAGILRLARLGQPDEQSHRKQGEKRRAVPKMNSSALKCIPPNLIPVIPPGRCCIFILRMRT